MKVCPNCNEPINGIKRNKNIFEKCKRCGNVMIPLNDDEGCE